MIPPAWLAVYRASNELGLTTTAEEAMALVKRLDSLGYTVAITSAFDKSQIPQGVKLPAGQGVPVPDSVPPLDLRAFLSEEEARSWQYRDDPDK